MKRNLYSTQHEPSTWRHQFTIIGLLIAALVVAYSVVRLQIFDQAFLQDQGDARALRHQVINAHRGIITDRNGEPLAVSTPVLSIWSNPKELIKAKQQLPILAKLMHIDLSVLKAKLKKSSHREFMYLRRQMIPEEANKILQEKIPGIYSIEEYRRYYPSSEVVSHLIGFTDIDDKGQEGLELAYDEELRGVPGTKLVMKDRHGRVIKSLQVLKNAKEGNPLSLSIDLRIQYLAYRELKAAIKESNAQSASAVILDAQTGEILAMVNQPSYNPNDRSQISTGAMRNRALTDVFEPGSTIKPFTVLAALSTGDWAPETMVNTNPGHIVISGHKISDHRNYGVIDISHVISKSSNVGATKLALSMEPETLWETLNAVGFGRELGIDFPGESIGILPVRTRRWRPIELATLSYGYGLAANTLQLARAYTIFADPGKLVNVSLFRLKPSEVTKVNIDKAQGIDPEKILLVRDMLEKVVQPGGTGTRAAIPGYRVAGKTGTVRMSGPNGYIEDKYMAIFAGFVPASQPRLVGAVIVRDPEGKYYGGEVAAPIFSKIMAGALRVLDIPPDEIEKNNLHLIPSVTENINDSANL